MKIVKYLFFAIAIVIIGFSVYVATLDGTFQAEEKLVVDAPSSMLFDRVNEYKTWEDWGPWATEDPDMIVSYNEKTSGEGAGYSWKSDNMDGSMRTLAVIPGKSIEQEIVFDTPLGESKSTVYWLFEEVENGTEITWGIKGEQSFWEKAYQLTQDRSTSEMLRPMLKTGLQNLADNVAKAMEVYEINVDGTTQHGGGFYMYMATASTNTGKALEKKRDRIFPLVSLYMKQNNINISGAPLTVYNEFSEQNGTVIISSGFPTPSRIIVPESSEVLCGFLPNQNVIKTTLKGKYEHLPEAWAAAKNYISEKGYELNENANPFEVYVTGPTELDNPAEWVTEVYIPIK